MCTITRNIVDVLAPTSKRNKLPPQRCQLGNRLEELGILVEKVNAPGTSSAKASTKHVFSQYPILEIRPTAAVKGLLCPVVNTGYASSSQVHRECIEDQIVEIRHSAKAPLVVALPHLIVIVKHGDHMLPEPCEITVIIELRISE
jgi:hypothetical protein